MTLDEYARLDATALAALVASGAVSAAELASLAGDAIARANGPLNAVVEVYEVAPGTGAATGTATGANAAPRGAPFAGVPLAVKDAGAAQAGRKQEFGSRLAEGRVAPRDAELTRRFRAAGLVPVGRTASPEFSLSLSTESALRGPTRNPYDPERLAGGSSGGAAAAVASGMVPVAHATDAAGSIRIPASACGVVGLKPSRGRVSHGPDAGEPLMGMDTEFVLTRSVRDAAGMLLAVAGASPGDPSPAPDWTDVERTTLERLATGTEPLAPRPLRLAVCTAPWGGYAVDPEVEAATLAVADDLSALGHPVEVASPTFDYEALLWAAGVGWALGFDLQVDAIARETGRAVDESTLEPVTLGLYREAKRLTATDVARAETERNQVARATAAFFESYDVLLTPTLLRLPERLGRYAQTVPHPDFASFFRLCEEAGAFLPLFNATGQPALSLPLAWSAEGLPIGMQFAGRYASEATLLSLAAQLERLRPWRDHLPPLHVARVAADTRGRARDVSQTPAGQDGA
jgi:amidase